MATTTNYGWDTPDDTDLVKDGALAMRDLGGDIDTTLYTALGGNYPGLRLVKKQTIGSGVTSVTVTNAFSATYENYKIVVSGGVSSANDAIALQLNNSATNYFFGLNYLSFGNNTPQGLTLNGGTNFGYIGAANINGLSVDLDLIAPFLTKYTTMHASIAADTYAGNTNGINKASTSHTGFTLIHGGGAQTFTGGTIYVYGYGAS